MPYSPGVHTQGALKPRSSLSRTTLAGALLVFLGATALVGYIVGVFAAEQGASFNWEPAAVSATAFATAVLAACTGALAYTTSRDVSATQEIAQQGKAEQEQRDRALVAVRSVEHSQQHAGGAIRCDIRLINVGAAHANYITVKVDSEDSAGIPLVGKSTNDHFLGPGDEDTISIELTPKSDRPSDLRDDLHLRVRGVFLDRLSRPKYFLWQIDREHRTFFQFEAESWS